VKPNIYKIDERLVRYYPDLPQVSFEQPSTPKFDAETVLSKEQIFEDLLPDRHMLLSAYFEIFNNALFYALKETEEIYIEVNLRRRENEIVIEVANETSGDNLQRLISPIRGEEEQYRARGAGVDTNILFFKSIGGDFRLIPETSRLRAVAVSRIDLQFLRELQKGIEP
jgi:hypothetical protein